MEWSDRDGVCIREIQALLTTFCHRKCIYERVRFHEKEKMIIEEAKQMLKYHSLTGEDVNHPKMENGLNQSHM